MPICSVINYVGVMCNQKSNELHYFWYYDPLGRINKVFHICLKHSNLLVDRLMEKEYGYSNLIKACFIQIEKKRKMLNDNDFTIPERMEAIKNAKENGLPRPNFTKSKEESERLKLIEDSIKELYEKISNAKKVVVIERNKMCRFCGFPLKEPESPKDQIGLKYAVVDFKSPNGYRRLDAMFHTECGIAWITNKMKLKDSDMSQVQPLRVGQQTIFSSIDA